MNTSTARQECATLTLHTTCRTTDTAPMLSFAGCQNSTTLRLHYTRLFPDPVFCFLYSKILPVTKMRLNVCFNEMALFGLFAALIKGCSSYGRNGGRPQEMANPQRMKVFAVERPGLPEDFVSFPALCGVQSSPLVFAPNLPIVWGPLQWWTPGETLCLRFAFS